MHESPRSSVCVCVRVHARVGKKSAVHVNASLCECLPAP